MAGRDRTLNGRYRVRSRLGSGGMGTVWLGDDLTLRRRVALKAINLEPGRPGEAHPLVARAMREAQALARVRHPSVVEIYDLFVDDGVPWLVMELVEGRTLADRVAEGPLPEREAAGIGLQALDGLDAVHRAGVLHRDVKPANILLAADGRVLLADFGIARLTGAASLTVTNTVLGTLEFMAPEQIAGGEATAASDLWALGVSLFCALEGYSPFRRGPDVVNVPATLYAIVHEAAPAPARPGPLADAVARLLDKDPAARLDSPGLRSVLRDVLREAPRPSRPAAPAAPRARVASARKAGSRARVPPAGERERPPRQAGRPVEGRTVPPAHAVPPGRAPVLTEDMPVGEAAQAVLRAGPAGAAPALLALPRHRAALILAALPPAPLGAVLDAMADAPEATALILPMFTAERAGRALGRMTGDRALAVLAVMPSGEAARIVAQAGRRTAAWVLGALPRPEAAGLLAAMPAPRAAGALAYVPPPTIAALLRDLPGDRADALVRGLAPAVRARVTRLM
ncbi:protein kinase [Actinomadura sp. DSM 109109]|nr:protein kinase [Actinomadura lepetitiana]